MHHFETVRRVSSLVHYPHPDAKQYERVEIRANNYRLVGAGDGLWWKVDIQGHLRFPDHTSSTIAALPPAYIWTTMSCIDEADHSVQIFKEAFVSAMFRLGLHLNQLPDNGILLLEHAGIQWFGLQL